MMTIVIITVAMALPLLLFVSSRRVVRNTKRTGRRSIWSYILLWPLIFDRRQGATLTKRELIGAGLAFLLLVLAVSFDL